MLEWCWCKLVTTLLFSREIFTWFILITGCFLWYVQFDRYSEDGKTISEKDFGNILLTYAGLPSKKMARMLKRVKKKFKDEPQVVQLYSVWKCTSPPPPPPPPPFFYILPPFPLLQWKVLQRNIFYSCCGGWSTFILACIGVGEETLSLKLRFCWTCTGKCSEAQSACVVSTRKGSVDITRHKGRLTRFSAEDGEVVKANFSHCVTHMILDQCLTRFSAEDREANFSPCVTHIGSVDQCLTRFSADGGEANSSPCVCCQGISFWLGFWLRMEGSSRPTLALVCVARGSVSRSTWLSGNSWRASMMWTQPSASTTWPVSPSTEVHHLSVVSSSLVSATQWPFHQCINRACHTVWCMLHNICMVTH